MGPLCGCHIVPFSVFPVTQQTSCRASNSLCMFNGSHLISTRWPHSVIIQQIILSLKIQSVLPALNLFWSSNCPIIFVHRHNRMEFLYNLFCGTYPDRIWGFRVLMNTKMTWIIFVGQLEANMVILGIDNEYINSIWKVKWCKTQFVNNSANCIPAAITIEVETEMYWVHHCMAKIKKIKKRQSVCESNDQP